MVLAGNRRPLTPEAKVRAQVGTCGICGEQSNTGTVELEPAVQRCSLTPQT
jgi:hypothetical protein